ncbi:MAG: hypothetical protein ACFFCO_11835 [Promethearchaeota archaeon]
MGQQEVHPVVHTDFLIVRLIKKLAQKGLSPKVTSIVIGTIFFFTNVVMIYFYYIFDMVMIGYLIAVAWLFVGPYLIYTAGIMVDELWFDLHPLIGATQVANLQFLEKRLHGGGHLFISVLAYFALLVLISPILIELPLPLLVLHLVTWWFLANHGSIGVWGVLNLIHLVLQISNIPFGLNPLHRDRFGGMGFLGTFCIRGTLMFSTGALMIPLASHVGLHVIIHPIIQPIIISVPFLFSALVALSFFIPLFALNKAAVTAKHKMLDKAGTQYCQIYEKYEKAPSLNLGIKALVVQGYFDEVEDMKEYPWDPKIVLKLLSAILFPVVLALFEHQILLFLGVI